MTTTSPAPVFDHLMRLTDRHGTLEHARLTEPLPEHGYCTDDVARVLIVTTRDHGPDRTLNGLAGLALRFLGDAQALTGACRNRMDSTGRWVDEPAVEDAWGRCIWGLGTAAAHSKVAWARQSAIMQFERAAQERSEWPRAMAFAVLGAAELLAFDPEHSAARDTDRRLCRFATRTERRPGVAVARTPADLRERRSPGGDDRCRARRSTTRRCVSAAWICWPGSSTSKRPTATCLPRPLAGRGAEDARPGFDQQPIEVSSLADACARAAAVDTSPIWPDGVRAAAAWFMGDNDAGEPMWDPDTGGGYDGLHADGVNGNQGAESTLAVISTLQHAQRLSTVPQ